MSKTFTLQAEARDTRGSSNARRLRRAGKIPAVVYGADQEPMAITLSHNEVFHSLEKEAFHSSIIDLEIGGESVETILRDTQLHPYKPIVLHIDLQRVKRGQKLSITIPLHFVGEDKSPGVKAGGILTRQHTELTIECRPRHIPEYIEVDVSGLDMNESVHLSEITLPEGVEITSLLHGGEDLAVAAVQAPRKVVEEETDAVAADEVPLVDGGDKDDEE